MSYIGSVPAVGKFQVLDDISSSFDGAETTFDLTVSGAAVTIENEANCIIAVGNLVQQPKEAYTVSGSSITFTEAPLSTDSFFGTVLGSVQNVGTPSDGTVTASTLSSSYFHKNNKTLTSLSLTGSDRAMLVGDVTVSGTITIPDGAVVTIL